MKKFLSILMLTCLLTLGMALPAAAEGEPPLFLQVEGAEYVTAMTIPEGFSKDVWVSVDDAGTSLPSGTELVSSNTDYLTIEASEGHYIVSAKKVPTGSETVTITAAGYAPVNVTINPSNLMIVTESGSSSTLTGVKVGDQFFDWDFQLVAEGEHPIPHTLTEEDIPSGGWIEPVDSLGRCYFAKAGTFQLGRYTGKVTVTVVDDIEGTTEVDLGASDDLNMILASKAALERFLGHQVSDSVILNLPESVAYEDTITIGQGMNGVPLTLQGNKNTFKKGLVISGGYVSVDGITFDGAPGIALKNVTECSVSNCKFNSLPFQLQTSENGWAPRLMLTGNIYTGTEFAEVIDYLGNEVGKWLATPKSQPETAVLNLGVNISELIADSKVQALAFYVDHSVNSVVGKGWSFNFVFPCGFDSAYAARNGVEGVGVLNSSSKPGSYNMTITEGGQYAVVSGSYPKIVNGNVTIRAVDAKYLATVTVDTTYSGATVTHNSKQVPASINNKKLTFFLNGAGTYKVASATTTVTKTTTTSRSYKYTYQDYYLVTPAGFTNAMRYAKDNLVTLNCTEAGRRSVSLPVASMAAAAEKGYSVLVKTKNAELTLDAAALKSLAQQAKGTTVLLHYKSLNHKTLTTVGQASIQSHLSQFPGDNADLAFLVTATSDSETIEDLQLGTITLNIPFIVLPGTEGMENTVYALQSESVAEARETTVAEGRLTTKLLDLTEHMVFLVGETAQPTEETTEPTGETTEATGETQETTVETAQPETVPETTQPAQPAEPENQGGNLILTLVIGLGVVLVIGGGVLGFLLLRKRFRK